MATKARSKGWVVAGVAAMAIVAIVLYRGSSTSAPAASPSSAARVLPPPSKRDDGTRVVAHVGPRTILSRDVARYIALRERMAGVIAQSEALSALIDRTLLVLQAREDGITTTDAQVRSDVMRRTLIAQAGRPARAADDAPMPESDIAEETREELLADKVKQQRIYEKIMVDPKELKEALAKIDAGPSDENAAAGARARIRRQRGAPELAKLLDDLRQKWKVEMVDAGSP